jgi:hypothetical protein
LTGSDPPEYSVDFTFLETLANKTKGKHEKTNDIDAVKKFFEDTVDGTQTLFINKVNIKEVVNPKLRIREESFRCGNPNIETDPEIYENFKSSQEVNNFHSTNVLVFPEIYSIKKEGFWFSFDVTRDICFEDGLKNCKPNCQPNCEMYGEEIQVDDLSETYVTYEVLPFKNKTKEVPKAKFDEWICVEKCGVVGIKEFDKNTNTMTLTIKNLYNLPLYDVNLIEKMYKLFIPIEPVNPQPHNFQSVPGGKITWEVDKIDPKTDFVGSFKVDTSYAADMGSGQLGMNIVEGTRATFKSHIRKTSIEKGHPNYTNLLNDLNKRPIVLSSSTLQLLKNEINQIWKELSSNNLPPDAFPKDFAIGELVIFGTPFRWYIKDKKPHSTDWTGSIFLRLAHTKNEDTNIDEITIYLVKNDKITFEQEYYEF